MIFENWGSERNICGLDWIGLPGIICGLDWNGTGTGGKHIYRENIMRQWIYYA